MAEQRERKSAQQVAESALAKLWGASDWSDPATYDEADTNGHSMFWLGARIASPEVVKADLASALRKRPEIVLTLVTACAPWLEIMDREPGRRLDSDGDIGNCLRGSRLKP